MESSKIIKFYFRLLENIPENLRTILQTILLSLAAGTGAVIFMTLMNALYKVLYLRAAAKSPGVFIALSFFFTLGSSLIVALLLKRTPEAAGSGIPQAKAAYWKELGYIPLKNVIIKFIAGIISIGGGASLGREGPTVYLGSGVASFLAGITGTSKRQRRAATAIGASAGLAAAFNTPLAAITFCIEELINDINTRYLGRVVVASLFGALTVYAFIGKQPAFLLPHISSSSWFQYLMVPVVACMAAFAGVLFQNSTLLLRKRLRASSRLPVWILPCFGGLITWIIGSAIFLATGRTGVFGLGYHDLTDVLAHGVVWWIAGVLVAAKLLATIVSYGFGGCGGIFSPTLFIGGMCGALVSGLTALWLPVTPSDLILLATVGMSACLGAVIRAPFTSTLIVFEMTHQFEIVPSLMVGAILSQLITRLAAAVPHNFYDALLLQDGHELVKIKPPRDLQGWQNLPVSHIMNTRPVMVDSLEHTNLKSILAGRPFHCFPYIVDGRVAGLLTRQAMEQAIAAKQEPVLADASTAHSDATVREAAELLVNALQNFLVLLDKKDNRPVGILTLHDLLRAQASVASE